jgi:hypothetical protein
VTAGADRLLAGWGTVLGVPRTDLASPDWFLDPVTGRRAPSTELAFRIDHRNEAVTGNIKVVWELSRHHHLTLLAAAWWLTGEERYATVVASQLRSWWTENPFLSGVHWTSGIELGVRLTSWVWVRRLLDEWSGVVDLFEENDDALRQIRWHQEYLAAFRSRGSSGNNHAVAEACGRIAGACAFPWFTESRSWRADAARHFEEVLAANTFPSGINRELATDYHRFVTELGLVALAEADRAGHPLRRQTRQRLVGSLDAAAALLDSTGRPPRQGDGDEGRGLDLDGPAAEPWGTLLAVGESAFGAPAWWPRVPQGVASVLVGALITPLENSDRPMAAPKSFSDAGIHLLRVGSAEDELWCRCDGGPHGFLSIAAHGHADALSIEVRHGGVDVLADPGTYCYHGDPEWRSYFRSTRAHNTVEVDGINQSVEGGPFMWTTHTDATVEAVELVGPVQSWSANHRGYSRLDPSTTHSRTVVLDEVRRRLSVLDTLTSSTTHRAILSWHLGPLVEVDLRGPVARLQWPGPAGLVHADLQLPQELNWSAHRGETDPILGWHSPRFGERVPSTSLVGEGAWRGTIRLRTVLDLADDDNDRGPRARTGRVRVGAQEASS